MQRFESYINTIDQAQESSSAFLTHGSQVLSGMITASQEQADFLSSIKSAQQELKTSMQDYADWSGRVLSAVQSQADGAMKVTGEMTAHMDESSQRLSQSYASFVENLSGGFSRALGMFDENIHEALGVLTEQLAQIQRLNDSPAVQTAKMQKETEGCIQAVSRLQRALTQMSAELEAQNKTNEPAEEN